MMRHFWPTSATDAMMMASSSSLHSFRPIVLRPAAAAAAPLLEPEPLVCVLSVVERPETLSAPSNALSALPAGVGALSMLTTLDVADNQIRHLPIEMGNLTPKKLQAVSLRANPLADPRVRRIVADDAPTMVKDLLNHVRKHGHRGGADDKGGADAEGAAGAEPGDDDAERADAAAASAPDADKGGKKKGGKKKGKGPKPAAPPSDDEDENADVAALLAQMAAGNSDQDE